MVQPDAKIRYLEFELDETEKMVKMMESSGSGAGEDRVAALEKKVNEMEALVKGLTQELLDLKSIAMKMSKQTEERSRQELKRVQPIVQGAQAGAAAGGSSAPQQGGSTVVIRKGGRADAEPPAPAEPAMDMIMQPDGTMKLEPRRGDKNYIVASAGYGRNKKGVSAKPKQSDLIYAVEEDKSDAAKK
jgi:TolA-binding protein